MGQGPAVKSDASGHCVALELMPHRAAEPQDLFFERHIIGGGQKVGFEDEAVALESRAILFANKCGQSLAAPFGHPMGQPHARNMQSGAIECRAADHRIVAERLRAGCESGYVPWREDPGEPTRSHANSVNSQPAFSQGAGI